MAKNNLYFKGYVHDSSARDFLHAEIVVWPASAYGSCYDSGITLTWQGDANGSDRQWYGFHITLEAHSLDLLNEKVKLARRVLDKEMRWDASVEQVLDRLETIATEVVHDPRLMQHVPLTEVLPATMLSWRDDFRKMGKSSCTVGCVAETESEAKLKILVELAKPHHQEYLREWLDAGQPVTVLDDKRPDVTPARERLALPQDEEDEEGYLL